MISTFFMTIVKILTILLILVGMVLLLVGMQHYLNKNLRRGEMDDSDNERFRRQINNDSGVMSGYNLFRRFLADDSMSGKTPTVPRFFQGEGNGKSIPSKKFREAQRQSHNG